MTRARPILEGTLGGIYDFKFMPDFGQGKAIIQDAYVTARFLPEFQLTAGKFKSPVGLERLQSASDIRFVARAFPTQIAPNRDIGLQIGGNFASDRVNYAVAYLNGSNDGSSSDSFSPSDQDPNSAKEWAGRLFTLPFAESDVFALRGLGIGIASTYTDQEGTTSQTLLPTYKTSAQSTSSSTARARRRRSRTDRGCGSRRSSTTTSAPSGSWRNTRTSRRTSRAAPAPPTARRPWTTTPGRSRPRGS